MSIAVIPIEADRKACNVAGGISSSEPNQGTNLVIGLVMAELLHVSVQIVYTSRSEGRHTSRTPKLLFVVVFVLIVTVKTSSLRFGVPGEYCVGAQFTYCHAAT